MIPFLLSILLLSWRLSALDKTPNVLFIMSEDLRPELPSYGRHAALTPNIQRIVDRGLVFDLVTCQVAICAPSRSSMLTGILPDRLGIYDFFHHGGLKFFRTIPSHFQRHGYHTAMAGKLFHWESEWHYSFDYWGSPQWEQRHEEEMRGFYNASVTPDSVHPVDSFFRDAEIVNSAIDFLKRLRARQEPWFLAVGMKGTHMQYQMPYQFWKQYDGLKASDVNVTGDHLRFPLTAPILHHVKKTEGSNIVFPRDEGRIPGNEYENYQTTGHGRTISVRGFEALYRGYLACLSYADNQLGRLLNVVDELDVWKDTIVVFTADHGMHVGEKGIWGKWTLFDETSRVPLIIHDPATPKSYGQHYKHPVELIDLFPTLIDLSKVRLEDPCPYVPIKTKQGSRDPLPGESPVLLKTGHIFRHAHCFDLDGTSLAPAFTEGNNFRKTRDFSLTQRLTCKFRSKDNDPTTPEWIDFCPFKKIPRDPPFGAIGYSMRFSSWRYIAWLEFDVNSFLPSLHIPPLAEELYDHRDDPPGAASMGTKENINLAVNNEYGHILLALRVKLYDYLWYNASFEHLFQKFQTSPEMRSIISGRVHNTSHPHWRLYPAHYYSHHTDSSRAVGKKGDAEIGKTYLPSIYVGKHLPPTRTFSTQSGIVNLTERGLMESTIYSSFKYFDTEMRNRRKGSKHKWAAREAALGRD